MYGVSILAVLATLTLIPYVTTYIVRLTFSLIGSTLTARTANRRDAIYTQYQRDEKQKSDSEEEWEKVEGKQRSTANNSREWSGVVGFFHPFCNAGGGGERVLWAAIAATQQQYPNAICAVYTGDHEIERSSLIATVKNRFDITLQEPTLVFIYLSKRYWVLPSTWPRFTLLGQALGSLILAFDAFSILVPDIFIDTMGLHFAVAFSRYLFPKVPTAVYAHYPTISTDMLDSLDDTTGEKGLHSGLGSGLRGKAKKLYWHVFAWTYGWVGRQIDIVMCNSTWTSNHITQLWSRGKGSKRPAIVVYPPCPVEEFKSKIDVSPSSEQTRTKENIILYIGQFRPEKNHSMVLRAFSKFYHSIPSSTAKLVLIGSVRANTTDERHIYSLKLLARELKIKDVVVWKPDASFAEIQQYLRKASIGVNGMYNEHFGIGNVEGLAAGLIPVVHNSGGPKLDIVVPNEKGEMFGYHAENDEEFAKAFARVNMLSEGERMEMRLRARESADRFTEEVFVRQWNEQMGVLVGMATG